MILLDVIVGYFIPDLFGWFFLVFVISIETLILRKLLKNLKVELKTLLILVVIANFLTTLIGYGIGELIHLDYKTHIGHLINLIPIDYYRGEYMFGRAIFIFIASFLTTMIFETLILHFGFKKHNLRLNETLKISMKVNLSSYFTGLIIICIYVAHLMSK